MEKLTMTWGWIPPQYEIRKGRFMLFYFNQKVEKEIVYIDPETGEESIDIIIQWICNVAEYSKEESKDILRMLNENPNSIECIKWIALESIKLYDDSKHVNSFFIDGYQTWLDKATRVGLKLRFEAEKRLSKIQTTLWQDGKQFPLPLEGDVTALDMLDGIELYASACYDVTQMHLAAVNAMTSIEEIKQYDYTAGYPEKLKF